MGPVIIDIMPGGSLAVEPKKLHPFFIALKTIPSDPTPIDAPIQCSEKAEDQALGVDIVKADEESPRTKRRRAAEDAEGTRKEIKKPKRGRKKERQHGSSITAHFLRANDEAGRLDTSKPSEVAGSVDALAEEAAGLQAAATVTEFESKNKDAGESLQHNSESNISERDVPPKKMLQLNRKTGTIGSPPKPKESKPARPDHPAGDAADGQKDAPKQRGRKPKSKLVKIGYGNDDASRKSIGTRIDGILDSASPSHSNRRVGSTTSLQKSDRNTPLNSVDKAAQGETYPFFTGKAKKPCPAPTADASPSISATVNAKSKSNPPRPRMFTSTPCSPKKGRVAATNMPLPQFGVRSLGLKTLGAKLPFWPAKGMVHIRGDDDEALPCCDQRASGHMLPLRKSKGNTTHVASEEMVLHDLATKLDLSGILNAVRNLDTENFVPPPPELRLPRKHFESGVRLERRVLHELKNPNHPALVPLRSLLPASLSSFDKYQCESASWAQKYTPKSAVEVLQYGKEAFLLRDWLQALKVQSVDTGEAKLKLARPPKKKRKKTKLDSFIVDSDEEADEMDEVSDLEEDWSPDRRGCKKTVVRVGDTVSRDSKNPARLTNTVVISGPPGCGKTASVYAVAKELEFEIFEINPSNRRNGKDIMEKIGDMTRNHLVQHQQTDNAAIDDEEVAEDIKSGKQATMNAFFKPKSTSKPAKLKRPASQTEATMAKAGPKKAPPKTQKQSLILLDEVDILYEEDKQFWSTVIGLIAQSKRPFVMTCNDESLVPLQTLNLHGIFRFSPPPADLAVDRLLMVAACEGHVLQRSAIEALYDARQRDIRACLMDLNYWCQFAVGDRRGAIEWFYPRWPKGTDIDQDGNVVRVISENAYVEGMGWLARDALTEETTAGQAEEELLFEAQNFWQVDIGDWNTSLTLDTWATTIDSHSDTFSVLAHYDSFADAMSVADLCSTLACSTPMDESVDCTFPVITNKAKDDYVLGRQLLDAPVTSTFDPLVTALPVCLKCLARKHLQHHFAGCSSSSDLDGLGEVGVVSRIRQAAVTSYTESPLTRIDFANAFDALAASDKASAASNYLDPSVFDGTFRTIVLDIAPFVRGIVTYENELQRQRMKLSNLLSQGGTKRMRKTRASHAALEGGSRSTTRAERWFKSELNGVLVMHTAGQGWSDALKETDSVVESSSVGRKARRKRCLADSRDDDLSGSSSEADII